MATKVKIRELALQLNLMEVANGNFPLEQDKLDFLFNLFENELACRKQKSIVKLLKSSNLPSMNYGITKLNSGLQYQIEKLLYGAWIEKNQNLLIVGECGTGKTSLATHIARAAIKNGSSSLYLKLDELLVILENKDISKQARATLNKLRQLDLLILDEFLYLDLCKEDLENVYRMLMSINDAASIIFVANREISEWTDGAEDKYTMQLLISRAISKSEVVRL